LPVETENKQLKNCVFNAKAGRIMKQRKKMAIQQDEGKDKWIIL
jgi:hypothetical protein